MKEFDTLVVASVMTGIVMKEMPLSDIHGAAEHLAGHPIWTHELGDMDMLGRISEHARIQFPDMPTRDEAQEDFEAAAKRVVDTYGEKVMVKEGSMLREDDPMTTLINALGERA